MTNVRNSKVTKPSLDGYPCLYATSCLSGLLTQGGCYWHLRREMAQIGLIFVRLFFLQPGKIRRLADSLGFIHRLG